MNLSFQQSGPLPQPDPDALAHSARLSAHIRELIRHNDGCIGFDQFMQEALYAPGLGYYSAGSVKFGPSGDFTTAPEVSPVFGRCLARQCAEIMRITGGGILELGAGSGRLAADILAELERLGALPESYRILEVSADLRERQAATVASEHAALSDRVQWVDSVPEEEWCGVLIANEVLDALPVRCFEIGDGSDPRLMERVVVTRGEGFAWDCREADDSLVEAVSRIEASLGTPLPAGYRSEVCMMLRHWLPAVLRGLDEGVAIFADYGLPRAQLYLSERSRGTLVTHYRHRTGFDFFERVGLQDLTAWVDFTALAEAADEAGWSVAGFTTQAHFLIGAGLEHVMAGGEDRDLTDQLRMTSEVKTLTLPGEMGERFKFMALSKGFESPLRGFAFVDLRETL